MVSLLECIIDLVFRRGISKKSGGGVVVAVRVV